MTTQLWWYVARAAGMVGWALLAASVVWGLAISTKTKPRTVRPNWMLDLHRFLGGLATIFTGLHVVGLVADNYTHFGPTEILVPFASSWHPDAVAWGVAAMYLLAAVELTSLARRRLPKRLWRSVHMASFPLFAFGTVHALTAGTDTSNPAFSTMVWIVCAVVVGLTLRRLQQAMPTATDPPPSARDRIRTTTTVRPVPAPRLTGPPPAMPPPSGPPCGPTPSTHPEAPTRMSNSRNRRSSLDMEL
jgi:Ferric reductase like transmembrane component